MTHRITIEYEVTTSVTLTIERDTIPTDHSTLLDSVTCDELSSSSDLLPIEWGHIKEAWRSATPENTWVYDQDNEPIFDRET